MTMRKAILEAMKVEPEFNVDKAIAFRKQFIKDQLINAGVKGLVLGISGGVDSSTAGRLCQLAVNELNETTDGGYFFVAMRLPYLVQLDEDDAQRALRFIQPSKTVTVNIGRGVNGLFDEVLTGLAGAEVAVTDEKRNDFVKGNVKARMRMIAQYAVANQLGAMVVGTDHSAEATMGFYTKFGDGACDIAPLFGLNKRQVRLMAKTLGADEATYTKAPTADLEELDPQALDEDRFGVTYDVLDDFLEGKVIDEKDEQLILRQYAITEHKRQPVVTPV